jgi:hypothetical protein
LVLADHEDFIQTILVNRKMDYNNFVDKENNTMKPLLFVAADYANITRDGKLNIMGIFHEVHASNFPARHSSMNLIATLGAEFGEWGQTRDFTIKLLDEDGNQVMDFSGQIEIPKGERGRKPEVNIILGLNDVVFPKPGAYQFVILVDKDHKGELTLYVNQIEAPKTTQE